MLFVAEMRNYTIAKSTKDHCVGRERYYERSESVFKISGEYMLMAEQFFICQNEVGEKLMM